MNGLTENLLDALNGARLVEVHKDDPDAPYAAMYVWHGGITVNVYGITDEGTCEAVDAFTYMDPPDRATVLASIARHWRDNIAYADSLEE